MAHQMDWGVVGDAVFSVRRAVEGAAEQVRARVEQQASRTEERSAVAQLPQRRPTTGPLPPIEIRVCTWNLHGHQVDSRDELIRWLAPDGTAADLFVIGLQELVDLGPRTVMMNTAGDEQRQAAFEARMEEVLTRIDGGGQGFLKVCSFGMVGLALIIYARNWLRPYLWELDCDRVKTGLDGFSGNKGGVCARFCVGDLSACFINVHLPSGQNATHERSQHLSQVLSDAFQGISARGGARPTKLNFRRASRYVAPMHHLTVVFGDMNARLDLPKEDPWPVGPMEAWLRKDQLLLGHIQGLKAFREGVIGFPPTYKYSIGTGQLSTSRCPAWCDRVVFKAEYGTQVELVEYDSFPALRHTSDHQPVAALFQVTLPSGPAKGKSLPAAPPPALPGAPPQPRGERDPAAAAAKVALGVPAPVQFSGTAYSSSSPPVAPAVKAASPPEIAWPPAAVPLAGGLPQSPPLAVAVDNAPARPQQKELPLGAVRGWPGTSPAAVFAAERSSPQPTASSWLSSCLTDETTQRPAASAGLPGDASGKKPAASGRSREKPDPEPFASSAWPASSWPDGGADPGWPAEPKGNATAAGTAAKVSSADRDPPSTKPSHGWPTETWPSEPPAARAGTAGAADAAQSDAASVDVPLGKPVAGSAPALASPDRLATAAVAAVKESPVSPESPQKVPRGFQAAISAEASGEAAGDKEVPVGWPVGAAHSLSGSVESVTRDPAMPGDAVPPFTSTRAPELASQVQAENPTDQARDNIARPSTSDAEAAWPSRDASNTGASGSSTWPEAAPSALLKADEPLAAAASTAAAQANTGGSFAGWPSPTHVSEGEKSEGSAFATASSAAEGWPSEASVLAPTDFPPQKQDSGTKPSTDSDDVAASPESHRAQVEHSTATSKATAVTRAANSGEVTRAGQDAPLPSEETVADFAAPSEWPAPLAAPEGSTTSLAPPNASPPEWPLVDEETTRGALGPVSASQSVWPEAGASEFPAVSSTAPAGWPTTPPGASAPARGTALDAWPAASLQGNAAEAWPGDPGTTGTPSSPLQDWPAEPSAVPPSHIDIRDQMLADAASPQPESSANEGPSVIAEAPSVPARPSTTEPPTTCDAAPWPSSGVSNPSDNTAGSVNWPPSDADASFDAGSSPVLAAAAGLQEQSPATAVLALDAEEAVKSAPQSPSHGGNVMPPEAGSGGVFAMAATASPATSPPADRAFGSQLPTSPGWPPADSGGFAGSSAEASWPQDAGSTPHRSSPAAESSVWSSGAALDVARSPPQSSTSAWPPASTAHSLEHAAPAGWPAGTSSGEGAASAWPEAPGSEGTAPADGARSHSSHWPSAGAWPEGGPSGASRLDDSSEEEDLGDTPAAEVPSNVQKEEASTPQVAGSSWQGSQAASAWPAEPSWSSGQHSAKEQHETGWPVEDSHTWPSSSSAWPQEGGGAWPEGVPSSSLEPARTGWPQSVSEGAAEDPHTEEPAAAAHGPAPSDSLQSIPSVPAPAPSKEQEDDDNDLPAWWPK